MTINIFMVGRADPGARAEFTFVITRDELQPNTSLQAFADDQIKNYAKTLVDYRFVGKSRRTVNGADAVEYDLAWRSDTQTMYQRQVILQIDANKLIICTATASEFLDDARAAQVDAFLSSLAFRGARHA